MYSRGFRRRWGICYNRYSIQWIGVIISGKVLTEDLGVDSKEALGPDHEHSSADTSAPRFDEKLCSIRI